MSAYVCVSVCIAVLNMSMHLIYIDVYLLHHVEPEHLVTKALLWMTDNIWESCCNHRKQCSPSAPCLAIPHVPIISTSLHWFPINPFPTGSICKPRQADTHRLSTTRTTPPPPPDCSWTICFPFLMRLFLCPTFLLYILLPVSRPQVKHAYQCFQLHECVYVCRAWFSPAVRIKSLWLTCLLHQKWAHKCACTSSKNKFGAIVAIFSPLPHTHWVWGKYTFRCKDAFLVAASFLPLRWSKCVTMAASQKALI